MHKALISIVIFGLCLGFGGTATAAGTATFGFDPTIIDVNLGDTFNVDIIAYPNGELIDTARALVEFDDEMLELQSYEVKDLFPSVSPGNYVDNSNGFVYIGGFIRGEQTSDSGVFATITFKAKLAGTSALSFVEESKMISIGQERINLFGSGTASVTVNSVDLEDIPEYQATKAEIELPGESVIKIDEETGEEVEVPSAIQVISLSHQHQNAWQPYSEVTMDWEITGAPSVQIYEYYYNIDKDPQTDPGPDQSTQETSVSFQDVQDGIWYFHIKALFTDGSYSDAAHYRVLIDTEAPGLVVPVLDFDTIDEESSVFLRFRTTDQASGIWYYEITVDEQIYATQGNEMLISDLEAGKHEITVKAYDLAGNWVEGQTTLKVRGGWSIWYTLGLVLIGLIILKITFRNKKLKK